MTIRVALNHRSHYQFDRPVHLWPHEVRLRPAAHARTPISSYSLKVEPENHFINWQQDPYGNWLARLVFPEKTEHFTVTVDLVAEMTVINPFDFFVEEYADHFPFTYPPHLAKELHPFLETEFTEPLLASWLAAARSEIGDSRMQIIDFLVFINQRVQRDIRYTVRLDAGVQTPAETLALNLGSCRDSAWLMVQILRQFGLAARFASGYLIQLVADVKPLEGASGPVEDFTDLHAWTEVYIPGAGWIGLDPTSGLMTGEGHIPLACTATPSSAAPVTGATEVCNAEFDFSMSLVRLHEDPRVTKPYREEEWLAILNLGERIDAELERHDVRLTMGGEPTFVSADDMEGSEWNFTALSPDKRKLAGDLLQRLSKRFAPGGLLHFGQGKWYPGEPLPRWALACYWREDGKPLWRNPALMAQHSSHTTCSEADAELLTKKLCAHLGLSEKYVITAYEDVAQAVLDEQVWPENLDPLTANLSDSDERYRLAQLIRNGLGKPAGFVLPLKAVKQEGGGSANVPHRYGVPAHGHSDENTCTCNRAILHWDCASL